MWRWASGERGLLVSSALVGGRIVGVRLALFEADDEGRAAWKAGEPVCETNEGREGARMVRRPGLDAVTGLLVGRLACLGTFR
jgi:hypothetical protein